jgi:hypothetical protein
MGNSYYSLCSCGDEAMETHRTKHQCFLIVFYFFVKRKRSFHRKEPYYENEKNYLHNYFGHLFNINQCLPKYIASY